MRTSVKTASFLLCFTFVFGFGIEASAARKNIETLCNLLLGRVGRPNQGAFLQPRPDYRFRPSHYRFNENRLIKIRNQNSSNSCWLHAGLRYLEACVLYHLGMEVHLSEDYLIAQDTLHRAASAIGKKSSSQHRAKPSLEDQRGLINDAFAMVKKHGAVSYDSWRPRIAFGKSAAETQRFLLYLNLKVDHLIKLRRSLGKANSLTAIQSLMNDIEAYFGPMPKHSKFAADVDNQGPFAPHDFLHHVIQIDRLKPYLTLKTLGRDKPTSPRKIAYAIMEQLEATHGIIPVPVSFRWVDAFYDIKNALFSVDAFMPFRLSFYREPRRLSDFAINDRTELHQFLIVDYEPGPDGLPLRFLAANSHGASRGNKGYVHIDWDYFEAFVYDADVIKDLKRLRRY